MEKKKYYICNTICENSSVGRASASQAEGRGFESRFSLKVLNRLKINYLNTLFLEISAHFLADSSQKKRIFGDILGLFKPKRAKRLAKYLQVFRSKRRTTNGNNKIFS